MASGKFQHETRSSRESTEHGARRRNPCLRDALKHVLQQSQRRREKRFIAGKRREETRRVPGIARRLRCQIGEIRLIPLRSQFQHAGCCCPTPMQQDHGNMCLLERISLKLLSSNQNRLSLMWTRSALLFSHHQFAFYLLERFKSWGSPGRCNGGNTCSISALAGSSQGSTLSWLPRCSTGSLTVKPGGSVAISNRTPPGSRK